MDRCAGSKVGAAAQGSPEYRANQCSNFTDPWGGCGLRMLNPPSLTATVKRSNPG